MDFVLVRLITGCPAVRRCFAAVPTTPEACGGLARSWAMLAGMSTASRRADNFVDLDDDPRADPPTRGDERATLLGFLRRQRHTLELKCSGLDAASLARRTVEPSTLSLLGLIRHMAEVECGWFRWLMAGQDAPPLSTRRRASGWHRGTTCKVRDDYVDHPVYRPIAWVTAVAAVPIITGA
jgi:hypothetical protein